MQMAKKGKMRSLGSFEQVSHGRDNGFAGWDARREAKCMVVPYMSRATSQTARKALS